MGKRIFVSALSGFVMLLCLQGCVFVNLRYGENVVSGKGRLETRPYEVTSFDQVEVNGNYEVVYRNEERCGVSLEMQENLFDVVTVTVRDGKLVVDSTRVIQFGQSGTPKIHLSAPSLKRLTINGAVAMKDGDTITGDQLTIDTAGAADLDISLAVTQLEVVIAGAGSVKLSGSADRARFDLAGAGSLEALALLTLDTDVKISGAGSGSVHCADRLNVDIAGIGTLEYIGDPEVYKDVSGVGSVKKIG